MKSSNWSESVAAIDFITALGRVLHDGALRDAFTADAGTFVREIELRENDQPAFLRLAPADLEIQARVLLRKRFDLVRSHLPMTCREMGKGAWDAFANYGRACVPKTKDSIAEDALYFSQYVGKTQPEFLCAVELNRCRFACEQRRLSIHVVSGIRKKWLPSLQVLIRRDTTRWMEWRVFLGA